MGFLTSLRRIIIYFAIFLGAIFLLPGLPPSTTFPFKEYVVKPPLELKGPLKPNFHLDGARHLWKDQVYGPENLIVRDEWIYTGIHGGEVIRLNKDSVEPITKVGQPCDYIFDDDLCGYPVGLAFDTIGNNLIIADAHYGIWQVSLDTKEKTNLVSPEEILPGKGVNRPGKLFNSVTVSREGDIYWTDSTSEGFAFMAFANPSGRLLKYNRLTKNVEVLLDELALSNGVALNPDEDFVVVAETAAMRLTKYYLKGPQKGLSEIFVECLPGLPDNLTPDTDGIWVPLALAVDSENPNPFAGLAPYPRLRFFLARLVGIMQLPFQFLKNIYPNNISAHLLHSFTEWVSSNSPNRTTIVRLDWNGNIVKALHGFDRSAASISHVLEYKGYLYLGSPTNQHIVKVKLSDLKQI
ncbi:adipocyte plasma membrane-associated protein-like [Drosophila eugracilis]|uniref:adipocyte plasma membrane-associated protein-like n=1 Tax=Drosophila eugracilis TaxID=29029 RepID=UPI0007E68E2F|nr:adipocyte plasma membrane-associated protein-like [Drosophila eugracilis]